MTIDEQYADWAEAPAFDSAKATKHMTEDQVTEQITGIVEDVREESALVTVQPRADHHIVTGMAALARMDDAEYEAAIATVKRGLERVKDFMQRAMTDGEDYGRVKGIDRPFLHLPGAEKLCLLYGLAARQEAERVVGTKGMIVRDDGSETHGWISPPLSYHVKTYVHLGSFDGPIVAMGYGEANSWETKYRYSWAKAKCPKCGHDLVRGKADGKLKGKWWCPSREGGCNSTYEPNDPTITPPGKVENDDPYSLAETLIQMAAKRSFVAATRRATGTSGLFTQDEDSPSVRQQSDDTPDTPAADILPEPAPADVSVSRGGKDDAPTAAQVAMLGKISKEKDLGPDRIVEYLTRLYPSIAITLPEGDRGAKGRALLAAIQSSLTADQMGALLVLLDTGEIDPATAAQAPGEATN